MGGPSYFADRASREALRLNPNNPKLLVARARVLKRGPALDVLDELEKLPGHADEARRLKEIVALYLPIPYQPALPGDCAVVVDRLVYVGKSDRAAVVVGEGLAKAPDSKALLARKAMLLALAGKLDESMELQKRCGYLQVDWEMWYQGLGDCLLFKGRPDLAIQSFGGNDPKKVEHRRILACAVRQTKDFARAEKLLKPIDVKDLTPIERLRYGTHGVMDDLLTVRVLLLAGQDARARELGARIVEPLRSMRRISGPSNVVSGPPSLKDEYARAVQWLIEQFPEKKDLD